MFAFLLWDTATGTAFGARDPFGIKPLHYLHTPDGVFFASEKKALLPFAPSAAKGDDGLDIANLSHYLTLQYVPEPGTLHRGIERLGPGQCFVYTPGGLVTIRSYYRAAFRPAPAGNGAALCKRIQETLRDSVRRHMISDVPVGAFLSSGIDSTALVALAREVNPKILTFTVGYDVPGYSEIEVAQDSARHLDVTTIPTKIGPEDVMSDLPRIVWHLDDPVADPSLVPLYFLARTAAEHVTVVLSGEGADEFFGGYTIYREPLDLAGINGLPAIVQRWLRMASKMIPEGVRGKSYIQRGTTPLAQRYCGNARIFTEADKERLLRNSAPAARYTDVTAPLYAEASHLDPSTAMQFIDLYTWLPGDILVKADRMTMAHSIEGRVPFLDRDVFEVAASIPTELKLPPHSTQTKFALRRALEGVVPPAIVSRKKLGFPTPTRVWLKDQLYEWARDILTMSNTDNLIDLACARSMLEEHRKGKADKSRELWTILIFCLWHAIFVEKTLDPHIPRNTSALLTKPAET